MHSEPAHSESEAVDQAASGNEDDQAQAAATSPAETPWALLAGTAAVLVGFVVAAVYAVRALGRRQRETGP
jgi:flagellar biogenesis protein FliO